MGANVRTLRVVLNILRFVLSECSLCQWSGTKERVALSGFASKTSQITRRRLPENFLVLTSPALFASILLLSPHSVKKIKQIINSTPTPFFFHPLTNTLQYGSLSVQAKANGRKGGEGHTQGQGIHYNWIHTCGLRRWEQLSRDPSYQSIRQWQPGGFEDIHGEIGC